MARRRLVDCEAVLEASFYMDGVTQKYAAVNESSDRNDEERDCLFLGLQPARTGMWRRSIAILILCGKNVYLLPDLRGLRY